MILMANVGGLQMGRLRRGSRPLVEREWREAKTGGRAITLATVLVAAAISYWASAAATPRANRRTEIVERVS
jgi:hypothetical protein